MSDLLLRSSRQKRKPLPAFPGGRQASIMRALWLAGSHSLPLIERTSRGYAFLLAGDTLRLLNFAAVSTPGTLFDPAVIRVEKITIGILSADLTDGFGLPVRPHIDTLPKQGGNGSP
ncbi:FUSC family protein, partial [Klebsiella quasipneumoniae]|uniref:FUSC family protein n=1 Tax=Klebsiella quasipneumoniae TaxID=1463165 RepID=UPI00214EDCFF